MGAEEVGGALKGWWVEPEVGGAPGASVEVEDERTEPDVNLLRY